MIKINSPNLNRLAESHYQQLKNDLIYKIDNGQNYIAKTKATKANKIDLDLNHKIWLKENLRDILIGKPDKLIILYKDCESKFPNINYNKVFDYAWFSSKERKYGAYQLANRLNIRTCCYCNRNYTTTVIYRNDKITRPQFDHFFYKKKYSLLALSFYNLIPSCNICNSNLKGEKDYNILHPYIDDLISNFRFKSIPQNITTLLNVNDDFKFEIEKLSTNTAEVNKQIDETINLFKLKEVYASHGSEVKDLYLLRYKYSKKYLEELSKMTKNKFSEQELFRLAFGTEIEESNFSNRPLSKMKKDILIELGIIK